MSKYPYKSNFHGHDGHSLPIVMAVNETTPKSIVINGFPCFGARLHAAGLFKLNFLNNHITERMVKRLFLILVLQDLWMYSWQ